MKAAILCTLFLAMFATFAMADHDHHNDKNSHATTYDDCHHDGDKCTCSTSGKNGICHTGNLISHTGVLKSGLFCHCD